MCETLFNRTKTISEVLGIGNELEHLGNFLKGMAIHGIHVYRNVLSKGLNICQLVPAGQPYIKSKRF